MLRLALELLLAPALVGFSTLAGRRWGAHLGGLVSAFPAVVGPTLLIDAQQHGAAFAAAAANATLLGLAALGGFALTYGWIASRARWPASVTIAWAAAGLVSTAVGWPAAGLRFPAGLGVAVVSLALAYRLMPRPTGAALGERAARRAGSLATRMILTAALVGLLAGGGQLFGPLVGGLLAALPILASVLAACTHRQEGSAAVVQLLRGMLSGMVGFVGFCAILAVLIVPAGMALAFTAASAVAIALQALAFLRGRVHVAGRAKLEAHVGPPPRTSFPCPPAVGHGHRDRSRAQRPQLQRPELHQPPGLERA